MRVVLPFLNHFNFLQKPSHVWPSFLSMYIKYLFSPILTSQSLLLRQTAWELTYVWVNTEVQLEHARKYITYILSF